MEYYSALKRMKYWYMYMLQHVWTSKHYVKKPDRKDYIFCESTYMKFPKRQIWRDREWICSCLASIRRLRWVNFAICILCLSRVIENGDTYYKGNWIINKETWFDNQELDTGFLPCNLLDIYFLDILLDILKAEKAQELVPKLSLGSVAKTLCKALIKY